MAKREKEETPFDDFSHAVETVRLYVECFQYFLDDLEDHVMEEFLTQETLEKMEEAGAARQELVRRIDVAEAKRQESKNRKH